MIKLVPIKTVTQDLDKPLANQIETSFARFYAEASPLLEQAATVNVTSVDQVSEMSRARTIRLALVKIKTSVDAERKNIKAPFLRAGQAIDSLGTTLRDQLDSVVKELKQHEDFAKIIEEKKKLELASQRRSELSENEADSSIYELDLGSMSEDAYQALLKSAKQAKLDRIEAEKKAEEERIENERKQKTLTERRIEIAELRSFFKGDLTINTTEAEFQAMITSAKEAKKLHEAEQEKIKKEQEAKRIEAEKRAKEAEKLRLEEQKKREEAEAKLKAQREEQEKAEREARAKVEAEAEQKRRDLLAPDKEKLLNLAQELDKYQLPAVSSKEAQGVIRATETMISKMTAYIREKAKAL